MAEFSILHLNIRSIKKNFENFKLFLSSFSFDYSIICLSETWLDDSFLESQSLYELPNYKSVHQVRNNGKGGGVSIYINEAINFKLRSDLSINSTDVESISVELLYNKKSNTLMCYIGHQKDYQSPLKSFLVAFSKIQIIQINHFILPVISISIY